MSMDGITILKVTLTAFREGEPPCEPRVTADKPRLGRSLALPRASRSKCSRGCDIFPLMQIRPATSDDLERLIDIDGTIESSQYLHVERGGEGLAASWRLEERS